MECMIRHLNDWLWIYSWSTSFPIVHKWSVYCVRLLFFNLVCRWYKHVYNRQIYSRYVPQIDEDLTKIQEWLCGNKLSLNVSKTHYMVFTPRNNFFNDVNVMINNEQIERGYVTKFLGMQIDAPLNWKRHIEYTCKKLSKCIGMLAKARKLLYKSCLVSLYYTFAYPYFIYCNHVRGNAYQTNLE